MAIPKQSELLKENAELRKQLALHNQDIVQKTVSKFQYKEYVDINPTKRIPVVSLRIGVLNLPTGDPRSFARKYRFGKFGETQLINYSDLADILHWKLDYAKKGYIYIDDPDVVSNFGLVDLYQNLIDKNKIENILQYSIKELIDIYSKLPNALQITIADLVAQKIFNGENIDLNKVAAMSKICGFDIQAKGTYLKNIDE